MSDNISYVTGELNVLTLLKGDLTLTSKRVRYHSTSAGGSEFISMTLDSVASCGLVTRSYPFLLFFAALAACGAFLDSGIEEAEPWMFFVASGLLVLAYILTRHAVISIASKGGQTILARTRGQSRSSIIEFLEALEREKLSADTPLPPPANAVPGAIPPAPAAD